MSTHIFTSLATSIDATSSKGALHALLQLPNGELLDVVTSHTQASYTYTSSSAIDAVQRSQIIELAEFICEQCEGRSNVIFGGDLNVDALQNDTNNSYSYMMEAMRSVGEFDTCDDLVLDHPTSAHPETTLTNTWDVKTGCEVIKGSYLGRIDRKGMEGEEKRGAKDGWSEATAKALYRLSM